VPLTIVHALCCGPSKKTYVRSEEAQPMVSEG